MQIGEPVAEVSPRSTVIAASPQHVISNVMSPSPNTPDRGATATDKLTSPPGESAAATNSDSANIEAVPPGERKEAPGSGAEAAAKPDNRKEGGRFSPPQQPNSYNVQGYPHLTPQSRAGAGYYIGYQSQVTPEPPSPAGPGAAYDMSTFFQQAPATFPHNSPFGVPNTPGSPRRNNGANLSVIPPASPLFPLPPRGNPVGQATGIVPTGSIEQQLLMDSGQGPHHPTGGSNLSVPYLQSPPLGPTNMYQNYPVNGIGSQSESPDDISGWNERRNQQNNFPQGSPQINQGIPVPYVPGMTRTNVPGQRSTFSFEGGGETMLPPSSMEQGQDNPAYSPYATNPNGSGGAVGGTLFAQQHPWAAYGGQNDMYANPGSPLQPRPTGQMAVYPGHGLGGALRPTMSLYGQYYPATSPGPPIQTTDCNKGPDGANLFIFHIPNHFTNADMYQLFCPYGNLLSVRIMVEKDTGRSRGFGFVSYDSPESAAHAIKELNGFAIGNKRLKVQHKQIRPSDQQNRDNAQGGYSMNAPGADNSYQRSYASHLPPSGAMAAQGLHPTSPWYESRRGPASQPSTVAEVAAQTSQEHQELDRNVAAVDSNNAASNSPATDNAALAGPTNNNTSPSPGVILKTTEGSSGLSPLASLEPLRNALPDVSSNVASRNDQKQI